MRSLVEFHQWISYNLYWKVPEIFLKNVPTLQNLSLLEKLIEYTQIIPRSINFFCLVSNRRINFILVTSVHSYNYYPFRNLLTARLESFILSLELKSSHWDLNMKSKLYCNDRSEKIYTVQFQLVFSLPSLTSFF